jgi:hypothetical protein
MRAKNRRSAKPRQAVQHSKPKKKSAKPRQAVQHSKPKKKSHDHLVATSLATGAPEPTTPSAGPKEEVIGPKEKIRLEGRSGLRMKEKTTIFLGDLPQAPRWQGDRIEPVLKILYPGGTPSREELPDAELCVAVQSYMSDNNLKPLPSSDSILRTAGRKKR